MGTEQPYTLISSPRTGSTLVYFIVRWYLIKKYGYRDEHLGEYFNPYHYNLLYRDVFVKGEKAFKENIPAGMQDTIIQNNPGFEIIDSNSFKAAPHKETFTLSEQNTIKKVYDYNNLQRVDEVSETLARIELLDADKEGKYFFKNHANPLPEEAFQYLINNYRFICVERLHKFDQYLSFAIANHTRIWMQRRTVDKPIVEEGSITYTRTMFDQLTNRIDDYYKRIKLIPNENKSYIWYEDIQKLKNKFDLLELLGFNDWRSYLNTKEYLDRIPEKQSDGNNLKYISNKDEFVKWYKEVYH